jgi:eukaryotic-like serine/threonine-protein kinase
VIVRERAELCGKVLDGKFLIERLIGVGGTGVVFEATHVYEGLPLALKMLRTCFSRHPDIGRRLRREGEVSRMVPHAGIVPVMDEGALLDGSPYIVMPLIGGESLSRLLLRLGRLPADLVAALSIRVAEILSAAHRAGYVHRDVKPEHVILDRGTDGELVVYLIDFGVCASSTAPVEERAREHGKVFGTPTYVSPEQATGNPEVDGRADLFSLGILIYEALTGQLPFTGSTANQILLKIIQENAPRVRGLAPGVPAGIDRLTARLLERNPVERLPSASALARLLEPYAGEKGRTERRLAAMLRVTPCISPSERRQLIAPMKSIDRIAARDSRLRIGSPAPRLSN